MYSVFSTLGPLPSHSKQRRDMVAEAVDAVGGGDEPAAVDGDLVIRGWYDVGGLRADADLMMWCHGPSVEAVQGAYRRLRACELGVFLDPVWSCVGMYRPTEGDRGPAPGFLTGEAPRKYLCVYPLVRSQDWYSRPENERSAILHDYALAAAPYPDVRAHTTSACALGDYEFLLAFDADEMHHLVDLMRALRAIQARSHAREETPFFTGPRVELVDWADRQPLD